MIAHDCKDMESRKMARYGKVLCFWRKAGGVVFQGGQRRESHMAKTEQGAEISDHDFHSEKCSFHTQPGQIQMLHHMQQSIQSA